MSEPRLLVFDLDGTLIDSEQDLAGSVNATLLAFSRPSLPLAAIRSYIGDGASMLLQRAFGVVDGSGQGGPDLSAALPFFLHHYGVHKLDHTCCYPGTLEALTTLRSQLPLACFALLTNKPVKASREICDGLDLAPFFFQIYGGNSFPTKKPHPQGLLTLLAEASLRLQQDRPAAPSILPSETVMIGDSAVDVATAVAVGAWSIGCTFGLSPSSLIEAAPTVLAHSPTAWPSLITGLFTPAVLC